MGNTLAFDSEHLSPINTFELLSKVTKAVVIHGFSFIEGLEFGLKECLMLGRHTSVLHFAEDQVCRYVWAHQKTQPWGHPLPLQCPQCGILKPWIVVHVSHIMGYNVGCCNKDCGTRNGLKKEEPYSFQIHRPACDRVLPAGPGCSWLKFVVV